MSPCCLLIVVKSIFFQIIIRGACFVFTLVTICSGKPQNPFSNVMPGNFAQLQQDVDFDNFEFMPEFDFDGFFKKLDAPAETTDERDFTSRRHQARSDDFANPTFYTNQRYSEITQQQPSSKASYDKLKEVIEEQKAEMYDDDSEDIVQDDLYEALPYKSQSIRRLDGPFEPYEPEAETERKRKVIKVKVKKPASALRKNSVDDSAGLSRMNYAEQPMWRLPIQSLEKDDNDESSRPSRYTAPSYSKATTRQPYVSRVPYKPYKYYEEPKYTSYEKEEYEAPSYQATTPYYAPPAPAASTTPKRELPSYEESKLDRRQDSLVQERQSNEFFDEPFQIPTFFRSNFEEPSFAQFSPPFGASGMFVDFLKTIGDVEDTIPFQESRTYVEERPIKPLKTNRYGAYETTENEFKETPRWFDNQYKSEAPSPSNGYFSNDYIQNYGVKSTTPSPTTTQPPATTEYVPKVYYKDFTPITESSKPTYQPPKYREPIKPIEPSYKPAAEVTTLPAPTTVKPTESEVYYKEDPNMTPGPVYYKPVEETTSVPAPDPDSVATAPKAPQGPPPKRRPPPPLKNQSFFKLPKFPKLPKAQPLIKNRPPPRKPQPVQKKSAAPPKRKSAPPPPKKQPLSPAPKKKLPPQKPSSSRKGKIPHSHKTMLHKIKDVVNGHKKFFVTRDGTALAQSTAVILPYVLSLL